MKIREGHFSIDNHNLWCKLIHSGNGDFRPTLVFLHDALGSVESWKEFPLYLCERLQLNGLVFDRKGHGKSEKFDGNYSIDYLQNEAVEMLPQILLKFNISNPIFIGHSDGGTIALIHASQFNQAIALVTIAGHILVEEITRQGIRETVEQFSSPDIFKRLQKYHGEKTDQLINNWKNIWLSEAFSTWNIRNNLSTVQCPCLIIQGMEDEYATASHAALIAESVGVNAELRLMEGVKHFPHREVPEKVIKEVNQFINKMILPR